LPAAGPAGASPKLVTATMALFGATVAMSLFAAPLQRYTDAAAKQLADRKAYARAVLGAEALDTTKPYRFFEPRPGAPAQEAPR
jgi:multicomponent K+:H+ antiporter subunit D